MMQTRKKYKRSVRKLSQGTEMYEFLRFPDAIAFENEVRLCNREAFPVGSRSVTNKCYALLWKARSFSSSLYVGVGSVKQKVAARQLMPSLVILAGDTFIDPVMDSITSLCRSKGIPCIFIVNKASIGEALNLDNVVDAVYIAFESDLAMQKEFMDAHESITSFCAETKRRYQYHRTAAAPRKAVRPASKRSVYVATIPQGKIISPLLYDDASSEWSTVSDGNSDFGIHEGEEAEIGYFREYIRLSSPTPALPLSMTEAVLFQNTRNYNQELQELQESSGSSLMQRPHAHPGPFCKHALPLCSPQKRTLPSRTHLTNIRRSWPFPVIYSTSPTSIIRRGSGDVDIRQFTTFLITTPFVVHPAPPFAYYYPNL